MSKNSQWILMAAMIWGSVQGCDHSTNNISQPMSLFGKNDLRFILPQARAGLAKTVGSLAVAMEQDGERSTAPLCTAIRVGRAHVLTAAHCVQDHLIFNPWYSVKADGLGDSPLEVMHFGEVIRLYYGGEIESKSGDWGKVAPELESPVYVNKALDFAVYHLNDRYRLAFQELDQGIVLSKEPIESSQFAIWGYPNGIPLSVAECTKGQVAQAPWFRHDCDAATGSSGALVGDPLTDRPLAMQVAGPAKNSGTYYQQHGEFESPEVFAVQRGCGSIPREDPNYAVCVMQNGMNRAIPLSVVATDIEQNSVDLFGQLATK